MKTLSKHVVALSAAGIVAFLCLAGCTTTQQTTSFNTIFSLVHAEGTAVDGYFLGVATGKWSTNGVPFVSKAHNKFSASAMVALDAVQFSTNALAPASLVIEEGDVINAINVWKGK